MFNKRLKALRSATGMTQKETAKQVGIARTTYAMYEQGKREPDISTLNCLATYFNVSVDDLLGENHQKPPPPVQTAPDCQSIERDLSKIINKLTNNEYFCSDKPNIDALDPETQEIILNALKGSLILARHLIKEKTRQTHTNK